MNMSDYAMYARNLHASQLQALDSPQVHTHTCSHAVPSTRTVLRHKNRVLRVHEKAL